MKAMLNVFRGRFRLCQTSTFLALQCAKAFVHVHLKKNPTMVRSVGINCRCFLGKDQLLGFLLRCLVETQLSVHRTSMNQRARFQSPKHKLQNKKSSKILSAVFSRNLDLKMASHSHKIQSAPIKNGRVGRNLQLEPF